MVLTTGKILTSAIGNDKVFAIPEGFTHIDEYVFEENHTLEKIIMPSTLKSIGRYAFSDCINLREVIFNNGIEQIGEGAFWGCGAMKKISLPASIREIDTCAFFDCTELEEIIIENSEDETVMDYIESRAFKGCKKLSKVLINKKVEDMGEEVFGNCKQLKQIHFPYIIEKYVPERCFAGCTNLERVVFQNNIRFI